MTIHARKMGRPSSFHQGLNCLDRALIQLEDWRVPRTLTQADRATMFEIRTTLVAAQEFFARANTAKGRLS